ncbi:MAG: nucleoside monophosphate kinase [Candidatus Omnitrophica bacterium]|nr:nucleoside monophosphate kinase [Candidatus Omnitrophota bacterium]
MRKRILILLGPPGAGKGTLGGYLSKEWNIPIVSSGDILRENLKKETDIGRKAKKYVESGDLVPDEIIIEMIGKELCNSIYNNGFILDGFSRTIEQAKMFDKLIDGNSNMKVIYL